MDLDILSLNPIDSWPPEKKRMWERIQILSPRIVEKQVDITSNLGSDFFTIKMTYGLFAQLPEANTWYHKVCALAEAYNYDHCEDEFKKAAQKTKFKTLKKLLEICRYHGIDTSFEDEAVPTEAKQSEYLPEGVDETQFDTYGFFEHKNQYFTLEKSGNGWKPVSFTNFKMKVLYHMENGMKPKRTIEITNIKGKSKRVDVETDKLVSKNEFKKLCEGYGNYRFFGSDGKLDMLKAYLYEQECPAYQITELGWHEDGFWAWSNGLFNSKFHPVDHNGHVELHDKHYIIPSGNMDEPGRTKKFSSQIRFRHFTEQKSTFTEYSRLYCDVFPQNGAIILTFSVACMFSDIVFGIKQFFPLLFIYGEGGSGKGSAIKMAQRLYGVPQDPLTLSGKANTDKAKIAIFAQFINTMMLLEEYTPNHDTDQLLKNLWDRYGYKRRTMDSGYNTETVPIQSGVAITSNFTPQDDPLLQRVIYLDHNTNQFSQDASDRFNKLKVYSEKGVTSCAHELLAHRATIEAKYRDLHQDVYKEIKSKNSALANCTDRMIENISVLVTMYTLLSENMIVFPFTRDHLIDELVKTTIRQNEKRDSGGEIQKFFDIFQAAVQKGELMEDVHYRIDNQHLFFNVKQVYGIYAESHRRFYNVPGLTLTNLRDKLKIHPAYSGYADTVRISGEARTSAFLFHYDKLGIDLIAARDVFKGMRRSSNPMNESYQDKVDRNKTGYQPAIDGPLM
jgi:hypothetical protein